MKAASNCGKKSMQPETVIFKLGELDRFTADPLAELSGYGDAMRITRIDNLAQAALQKNNPELTGIFEDAAVEYYCCASRPRAVRALLDFAQIEYRGRNITWINVACDESLLKGLQGAPWYPVIDRERCSGCGICYDYCIFATYQLDQNSPRAQRVKVAAPLNCKQGCPACARICPSGALIFPFSPEAVLNGALEDKSVMARDELIREFEKDPIKVLEQRRAKRRLLDAKKVADVERKHCSIPNNRV